MAIEFPRVPEVEPGDRVTSTQLAKLADAINARIVSGLGDGAFRIAYYYAAAARQFRLPNVDGSFPPQHEFFSSVQMLDDQQDTAAATQGNFGGTNPSSLLPIYVYGQGSFPAEREALADQREGGVPTEVVTDAEAAWDLAKRQRGAVDAEQGAWAAPAMDAARHVFRIVYGSTSVHGNAYGGWQPTPAYLGACDDGTSESPPSPNYDIFFTNTKTGAVESFDGTCPDEPTHIAGIWSTPIAYWVALNDGTVTYLDRGEWIEGPYSSGNALRKTYGEHLPRILNAFSGEFRGGSERQEKEERGVARWLGKTFDIASFLTRPYYLSPARGTLIGDSVAPFYPSGQRRANTGPIGSHSCNAGHWVVSGIIRARNLRNPVTVAVRAGGEVVATVSLAPSGGNAAEVFTLRVGQESVQMEIQGTAYGIGEAPTFSWELAEVYQMRPGVHDLWTVLRLSAVKRDATPDGTGKQTVNADALWESYARWGCIARPDTDSDFPEDMEERQINVNAVFDTFRRQSRCVRAIVRQQLRGYAVEGGKSILWIAPMHQSVPGLPEQDSLKGIRDAIAHEAPKRGYTNEWVAFPRFTAYHPSDTSLWARKEYSDWFPFSDRCAFYASPLLNIELRRHFNNADPDRVNLSLAPEAATGYRYAKNLNQTASEEFYKSCRLYEPPLEIESAETVEVDGETQVKVTFKTRFHHHETAPSEIDRDVSSWDLAALATESASYRTEENAIRDYLAWADDPSRQCEYTGPGNSASGSSVQLIPDNPFGTCFPTLWLVQLMPKPYEDSNDTADKSDTPISSEAMRQAETYIRCICEGYVDGKASVDYGCATGVSAVFDYTFANLCFDAFGGTSITTMPTVETRSLRADDIRDDSPIGYGPLPTVRLAAEQWNQYAKAVNKLTRVRVSLPFKFETQAYDEDNDHRFVPAVTASGIAANCALTDAGWRTQLEGGGRTPTTQTSTWAESANMQASNTLRYITDSGYSCSASGSGPLYEVANFVIEQDYRFELVDPDALNAIPPAWRDMLSTGGEMIWIREYEEVRHSHAVVPFADRTLCAGATGWFVVFGETGWRIDLDETIEDSCVLLPSSGRTTFPQLGTSVLYGAETGATQCSYPASISIVWTPVVSDALILRVSLEGEEE